MPTLTITCNTDGERQAYERAIAYAGEMLPLGQQAPDGGVLDACEALMLSKGQGFLRESLAGAVQARIVAIEKK